MNTIRVGVIGVGQIGQIHLDYYQAIPGAEVVAICDVNADHLQVVQETYHVPHAYTDYRELLARDDIVSVDVALHNNLHLPMSRAALQAGKHVYCEKPMAGSYVDARAMVEAARENDRHLGIQLNSLFQQETRAAQEIINHDLVGRIYHARSVGFRRRFRPYVDGYGTAQFVQKEIASGGALYDMGVYHIARILYLLGNPPPLTITGNVYQEIAMDEDRRQHSGFDVEEFATGFVRLAGGISFDILETWAIHADKLDGSLVLGSNGGVRLDPFGFFWNVGDLELDASGDLDRFAWRKNAIRPNADAFVRTQNYWIATLQGRVPPIPLAELALNTMLISEGIYLSHQLGREVTPQDVEAHSRSTALDI